MYTKDKHVQSFSTIKKSLLLNEILLKDDYYTHFLLFFNIISLA